MNKTGTKNGCKFDQNKGLDFVLTIDFFYKFQLNFQIIFFNNHRVFYKMISLIKGPLYRDEKCSQNSRFTEILYRLLPFPDFFL